MDVQNPVDKALAKDSLLSWHWSNGLGWMFLSLCGFPLSTGETAKTAEVPLAPNAPGHGKYGLSVILRH
eukprot:2256327-Amphidinium_carterae.1